jgi:hypothetical protein
VMNQAGKFTNWRKYSSRANRIHAAPIIGEDKVKLLHVAAKPIIARKRWPSVKRWRGVSGK